MNVFFANSKLEIFKSSFVTPGGNYELYANLTNIEDTSATSFLLGTNKFTVNSTGTWHNTNGTDYIYLAIK